jgi:hypothetical protein
LENEVEVIILCLTKVIQEELMTKRLSILLFALVVFLGIPMVVNALGLDVSVQAGGGAAMGTSDDANKSGKLRWAAGGGVALDVYVLELNKLAVGFSSGTDYVMLNYYAETTGILIGIAPFTTDRTSESRYNYLNIPFVLVGMLDLNKDRSLIIRAGGFAGYFLSGTVDNTYTTEWPPNFVNGEVELNDAVESTEQWQLGLRFAVGMDLIKKGKISIFPLIQFDMGLTDTSIDSVQPRPSKDTFWALTTSVGVKYSLF